MMDVCYKHNLAVIIVCINFRPETVLTSFRFKVKKIIYFRKYIQGRGTR